MAADNADRIRQIRKRHFPNARTATTDPAPADDRVDALQTKYEMELAAHRETTQRLLDEKDSVIELLRQQVADLRNQLERHLTQPPT